MGRWFVEAMDCPVEEQLIRNRLRRIEGITRLDFDLMDRVLTVGTRGEMAEIDAALASLDLGARRLGATNASTAEISRLPLRKIVALCCSGGTAALAEGAAWWLESRGVGGADHAPFVVGAALLSLALSGPQTLRKGIAALRSRTLNINLLVTLAVVGAVVLGQWPEASMASFLFTVAEAIEGLSLERARAAIRSLLESSPEVAEVVGDDGLWTMVPVGAVALNERVRVRPGGRVPLDGRVVEGFSAVDQAAVTGESLPVEKAPGDTVYAGTLNASGTFVFEVEATAGRTTLDRIVASVKRAQAQRAPIQRFVDRFSAVYTPGIVLLAATLCVVPPLFFGEPPRPWAERALVLLVIACPCALVISTPVTVVSGLTAAARAGLLIKGGAFLEMAARVRTVAFDKTGTLTTGAPQVTDVVPLSENGDAHDLLHLAASLNAASEHPIAAAIVADCASRHDCAPLPVAAFESLVGRGVAGTVDGLRLYLGSHRLVEENAVCGPDVEAVLDRLYREGKTGVVLTSSTTALAVLGVRDTLRAGAADAVRELQGMGLSTLLISGDGEAAARAVAAEVGIEDVRSEMLPDDKLDAIEACAKDGPVAMVGDGVNDGPALARADIGIAMGREGADTALEIADVALLRNEIALVSGFFRLARATNATLRANIAFAIGVKLVFFGLALAGRATLWMAVLADVGASLLVTANGLRLLRFPVDPTLRK